MILIRNRLNAGFFSNLNAVLGWYWYSMRTEIPIHVSWGGLPDSNIFDVFYTQKYPWYPYDYEHNANVQHSPMFTDQIKEAFKEDIGETIFNKYDSGWFFCRGQLYTEPFFDNLRRLYNYIYTENLKFHSELIQTDSLPQKTLGVNYRFIHFYQNLDDVPFDKLMSVEEYNKKYLNQIEKTMEKGGYEKIYLASSHKLFFDVALERFKDKLLYLPMKRVEEHQTEYNRGITLMEEFVNVLKDVTNLTKCDKLLVSPSNLIFGTLYINPDIKFEVVDFLKQTHTC